jgi:arginine utilization protein RocB
MEHEIEKKIKDLKEFIKNKTDQGTTNYLGKELRELCGMVETQAELRKIDEKHGLDYKEGVDYNFA